MAVYSELPVYKTVYQILLLVVGMSSSWQRDYRYTLGQDLKQELVGLLVLIYRANGSRDRHGTLGSAREGVERVKIYIRLLKDLRQIGAEKYVALADLSASASKQLSLWQSKIDENNNGAI